MCAQRCKEHLWRMPDILTSIWFRIFSWSQQFFSRWSVPESSILNDEWRTSFGRCLISGHLSRHAFSRTLENIYNVQPQKDKQRSSTMLLLSHLKHLDLQYAHDDYAGLFLLKRNTCLLRLSKLCIEYQSLRRLTNDFNSDSTHFNIHGLRSLDICQSCTRSRNFAKYFPMLEMVWMK
jgi:hypothetical protein